MNRTSIVTLLVLVLILALAFYFLSRVQNENNQESLEVSQAGLALSEVTYTDINGEPVKLSQYVGQPVVAVVWASWCPDCLGQLRLVEEVAGEYQGLKAVAFNRDSNLRTVKDFIKFYDIDPGIQMVMDPNDHFFNSVGGYSMPETVIFDSSGNIHYHSRSVVTKDELIIALNKMETEFAEE